MFYEKLNNTQWRLGKLLMAYFIALTVYSCNNNPTANKSIISTPIETSDSIVFKSDSLIIKQLASHTYQHISYLSTESFGNVACNGMIVANNGEAIIFDSPTNNFSTEQLIDFVKDSLKCSIKMVIPTHFHADCIGGLEKFHQHEIPSFAEKKTQHILHDKNKIVAQNSFDNLLKVNLGGDTVVAQYFGKGHTFDNIVGYFAKDKALFGGCLVKEMNAGKGNLEDASVKDWSNTVERLKLAFPEVLIVIPGHGNAGGTELLEYTSKLFFIKP